MANPKSLKPFKKGADPRRNLKGRPPGRVGIKTLLNLILAEKAEGKDVTLEELLVRKIVERAIKKGDLNYATFIVEHSGEKMLPPSSELGAPQSVTNIAIGANLDATALQGAIREIAREVFGGNKTGNLARPSADLAGGAQK